MGRIIFFFKKLFSRKQKHDESNLDGLRLDFKRRYHSFKHLLTANNRSLEIMADIERSLQSRHLFDMSYVRNSCTAVAVSVFQMVQSLDSLAAGKYKGLHGRFNQIRHDIDQLLSQKKALKDTRLVIPLCAIDKGMVDLVGSKMANLGELKNRVNLRVPDGFCITTFAFERFIEHNDLKEEINRRFQSTNIKDTEKLYMLSSEIQQHIIRSDVPKDLEDAVSEAWRQLEEEAGFEITVALRSSALGEDVAGSSFAGQYRSELNVSADNVMQAYKEIVASKYSPAAITYRLSKGFKDEDISMCVGCSVMVDAVAGGVNYSCNPLDPNDDSVFINAAWGLPKAVVDGISNCDLFVVTKQSPMQVIYENIKVKERKFVCYPLEGICRLDLTGDAKALPSLNQEQTIDLAQLAVRIEEHYAYPQDIEWAIAHDGTIFTLQCRPLQQKESIRGDYPGAQAKIGKETILARGGETASPGAASGKVFLAERLADMLKFPQGAILVVRQALPRWAPLLNSAAGVITEQGGFAGHLANVAREFGVPALFSVPDVMNKLNHADLITLDAGRLTIYKGQVEHLLTDSKPKKNFMEGSPVYETLKQASRHIVALNLIDPDSIDFKPANCMTFHDITRYAHEKSVQEMFDFGKEHNFSERSSKQLYYNVPMQWWILNLDDGFKDEVKGKYVRLENITSIPMLAFWEGFTAIPWDGPPSIDGKGFLSVMFQSTMNRDLVPGARSRFVDRNYFMISKNYCNQNSRVGHHFAILEALVGDRPRENYISFQFKGGAADDQRRSKRVLFIGDILDSYGFRVQITADNLVARIEGYEMEYMKQRLEVLGYLSQHTRQIDMIMTNAAEVGRYRAKFDKDIDYLLKVHARKFHK